MSSEIAQINGQRRIAEVQPASNEVGSAVAQVMQGLGAALGSMDADDISVELSASTESGRSTAKFHLRAYKHRKVIIDEEKDI